MVGRRYPDEIFSFLRGAGCLNGPGPAERLSELRRCGDRGDKGAERRFLASPVSFARLIWGAGWQVAGTSLVQQCKPQGWQPFFANLTPEEGLQVRDGLAVVDFLQNAHASDRLGGGHSLHFCLLL